MNTLNQSNLDKLKEKLAPHPLHLSVILDGAAASFLDTTNPLRFTNTANGLRELLREQFVAISPDKSIQACAWYIPDPTSKTGVTRRHRTLFAVYSYLDPQLFPTNFGSSVEALARQIGKQVDALSAFTHITQASLGTPEQVAIACFDSTVRLFLRLFDAIHSAREHLKDAVHVELQQQLADIFTSDFFDELDILSTHTRPQDAEDVEVDIENIGEEKITFTGTGSVLCNLQYGSDGDCRRGDGLEFSDSYPFTFSGEARTANPSDVTVDRRGISIDTSSFYK